MPFIGFRARSRSRRPAPSRCGPSARSISTPDAPWRTPDRRRGDKVGLRQQHTLDQQLRRRPPGVSFQTSAIIGEPIRICRAIAGARQQAHASSRHCRKPSTRRSAGRASPVAGRARPAKGCRLSPALLVVIVGRVSARSHPRATRASTVRRSRSAAEVRPSRYSRRRDTSPVGERRPGPEGDAVLGTETGSDPARA